MLSKEINIVLQLDRLKNSIYSEHQCYLNKDQQYISDLLIWYQQPQTTNLTET